MEDNVGTIVIATKVDTNGVEKGMQEVNSKVAKLQSRLDKKGLQIQETKNRLWSEKARTEYLDEQGDAILEQNKALLNEYETFKQILSLQEQGIPLSAKQQQIYQEGMFLGYEEQALKIYDEVTNIETKREHQLDVEKSLEEKLRIQKLEYQEISKELEKQKQASKKSLNLEDFEKGIGKMEKGFAGMLKKAFRLGLALVGIRTIINLITRSFNTLSQYNEELGTKVEQMRLVLAVALEPVINWIVSLLQQALTLVNQIMSSLFGMNLFGRASELWSKKMAKNMASGAGSAKEIKKQLAGFDEMNVLQDNQASSGGGGGGASMEPWDLEEEEAPWMKWVKENGSLIAGILAGIATALGLIKLGIVGIGKALGIGTLIAGIVMLIMDIIDYLKDPTWEKFGNIIRDIGIIVVGIGIVIGGIPGLVVAVIGAIVALTGIVIEHWDKVKTLIQGIADWFKKMGDGFKKEGKGLVGAIFEMVAKGVEDLIFVFENFVSSAKAILDGIIEFLRHAFKGEWDEAWESLKKSLEKVLENIKQLFTKTWERLKENFNITMNAIKDTLNKQALFITQVILYIDNFVKSTINNVINWIINKFNKITEFFRNVGIAIGDFIGGAVRGAVNGALSFVENRVNDFIRMINNVISIINKIPGVSIGRIGYISLPRMAVGGIINQPGRGVPVGGAIAGESGREGILPLTDKQAMAELGREIGKWISIQATVPVNIGNRQVARVIQELNNDREFAMNS